MGRAPSKTPVPCYGVGEIYGHDFAELPAEEVRRLAAVSHKDQLCRFRGKQCKKQFGVCCLRLYKSGTTVRPLDDKLITVCPERFREGGIINAWIGETLLGTSEPDQVTEVPFLSGPTEEENGEGKPVGKIDGILVRPGSDPLVWCAVEQQAVYFSGEGMKSQFTAFAEWTGPGAPWPDLPRRPDYRSSGSMQLMLQLQMKVPLLQRWGKKMAIVTDRPFFEHMGKMKEVADVSNCDIAWFVVDYEPCPQGFRLARGTRHFVTLERAIEGLIAGNPMTLPEFERRILLKTAAHHPRKTPTPRAT